MHLHDDDDDSMAAAKADVYLRGDLSGPADPEAAELRGELSRLAQHLVVPPSDGDVRAAADRAKRLVRRHVERPIVAGRIGPNGAQDDSDGGSFAGRWIRWPLAAAAAVVAGLASAMFFQSDTRDSLAGLDRGGAVETLDDLAEAPAPTLVPALGDDRAEQIVSRYEVLFAPVVSVEDEDEDADLAAALAWLGSPSAGSMISTSPGDEDIGVSTFDDVEADEEAIDWAAALMAG